MATSNESIQNTLDNLPAYVSPYSGEEVDAAVKAANEIMPWLDQNLAVPYAEFTGDQMRQVIAAPSKDMWLKSITLQCVTAFSASVSMLRYSIYLGGEEIIQIPNAFMVDTGETLVYDIERPITAGTNLMIISTGTAAYGNIRVKTTLG